MRNVGFGVITSTRGFFNPELAYEGRNEILKKLRDMGYATVSLDEETTRYGLVETMEDAAKCAELFKKRAQIEERRSKKKQSNSENRLF